MRIDDKKNARGLLATTTAAAIVFGLQSAKADLITFGSINPGQGMNQPYEARGVSFYNIEPFGSAGMVWQAATGVHFPSQNPQFGVPMVIRAAPGTRFSEVSLDVLSNTSVKVHAYRGSFAPENWPASYPSPLGPSPQYDPADVIPGFEFVKTVSVPGSIAVTKVSFSDVGPIDFITVAENTDANTVALMDNFLYSKMPKQIIHLDFDNQISQRHEAVDLPWWNPSGWDKKLDTAVSDDEAHPVANISAAHKADIEREFRSMLAANGLNIQVVTQLPANAKDNVLTVRFGQPVTYDDNGDGISDGDLAGRAFDVLPTTSSSSAGVDRFNRRRDGEVGIFLDNDYYASDIASIAFHEVAHAFGVYHTNAATPFFKDVMDYDYGGGMEYLYNERTPRVKDPHTGETFSKLDHNPYYHWLRYAEDADPRHLESRGLKPGGWDVSGGDAEAGPAIGSNAAVNMATVADKELTTLNAVKVGFHDTAYDVFVNYPAKDLSGANDVGGLLGKEGIVSSFYSTITGVDTERAFHLIGRSQPGGAFDLVFGFGTPENPTLDWREGIANGLQPIIFKFDHATNSVATYGSFDAELLSARIFVPEATEMSTPLRLTDTGAGTTPPGNGNALFNRTSESEGKQLLAGQFTLADITLLDSVDVWMIAPQGRLTLRVYSDHEGIPAMELFNETFDVSSDGLTASWVNLGALDWGLDEGVYWIALEPEDGTFGGDVPNGAPSPLSSYAFYASEYGEWVTNPFMSFGLQINGAPVPEPATASVMLLSSTLLLRRRRNS